MMYLYQLEIEKIFYFSEPHFHKLEEHFHCDPEVIRLTEELARGTFEQLAQIDGIINESAKNWSLLRMAATDRAIIRLAVFELLAKVTPSKVILNEAIELAKKFGTEHSGKFVNGILDAIAKQIR